MAKRVTLARMKAAFWRCTRAEKRNLVMISIALCEIGLNVLRYTTHSV